MKRITYYKKKVELGCYSVGQKIVYLEYLHIAAF